MKNAGQLRIGDRIQEDKSTFKVVDVLPGCTRHKIHVKVEGKKGNAGTWCYDRGAVVEG